MAEVVFVVSAALMLVGALGVVVSRNPVHAALFLVQTLMGVALLFILQGAHFLAAVQVVVYAGAIVILFLFVIMLLGVDKAEELQVEPIIGQRPLAMVVGAALAAALGTVIIAAADRFSGIRQPSGIGERALDNEATDIERMGRVLFGEFAFAVEITAALLTIAVVGAVVLTRRGRSDGTDAAVPASGAGTEAR